jgi:8-oxo-dGTP pyrophosphatase MutT (NUDIX family)
VQGRPGVNNKKVIRKAKKGRPIRQVAAVPFRLTSDGEMQVMLITSRSTRRFIVPKGWKMKGKSGYEAASMEAFEEAGVSGQILKPPVGRYRYWKRLSDYFVPVDVTVYLLSVDDELVDWEEAKARQRAWLSPPDAATLIDEPELASLVGSLSVPQGHGLIDKQ